MNNVVRIEFATTRAPHLSGAKAALLILIMLFGVCATSMGATEDQASVDVAGEFETARSVAQAERKAIVARNMTLTAAESEQFWPLYNRYRYEMSVVQDRQFSIIVEFAEHYENLDDPEARRILDKWLAYESDLLKLRARYVKRFAKVLPGAKLARYFQIENRLDAISNLNTASRIPLAH